MPDWLNRIFAEYPLPGWLATAGAAALTVLLAALLFAALRWLALRGMHAVMIPLLARAQREGEAALTRLRTLEAIARSALTYVLLFVALVTLLGQLGVNVAAILTGAGVVGLAVSFGSQRLIRDVLTGFFLLLEDQFRVGEVVTLAGVPGLAQVTGTVVEVGLRITRLRDVTGRIVTVGNGDIAAVVNHQRGPLAAAVEVGVAAETPLDRLRELAAGLALPESLFTGPAALEGVTALGPGRITVRIAAPAAPGRAPEAELALRQALGEALRAAAIEVC
jgi:moderate conductance mechanosensitive channel